MNFIIGFIGLIILFQFFGDVILNFDLKLRKYDNYPYSMIEQFTFTLIIGMTLSSFLSLLIVYFIPFSLSIFIILIIGISIPSIYLLNIGINNLFWIRLIKNIKNHIINRKILIEIAYLIISIICGIVLYEFIFKISRIEGFYHNNDIFVYIHHSLDAIRNGWNLYDPNYLGMWNSSKIFQFFLIPFVALDPVNWYSIVWDYLSAMQFFLFYALILPMLYRINKRPNLYTFIIHAGSSYFATWFLFFLPTNWNILLIIMLLQFCYIDKPISFVLGPILIGVAILFHFSTILFFGIPMVIIIILRLRLDPKSFTIYLFCKNIWISKKKKTKIIFFIFFVLLSGIGVFLFKDFIIAGFNQYLSYFHPYLNFYGLYEKYGIIIRLSSLIILISFIYYLKHVNYNGFFKENTFIVGIIFAIFVYMFIVYLNFDYARYIIRSIYLPYRFKVIFDFSIILFVGIIIDIIFTINWIQIFNKLWRNAKKINNSIIKQSSLINKIINFGIISVLLFSIYSPLIQSNITQNYKFLQFSQYWPKTVVNAIEFIQTNADQDQIYSYNEKSAMIHWNIIHTYLGDMRCIDLTDSRGYYDDNPYNPIYGQQDYFYGVFLNYVFNKSKPVYSYAANYKNLPESMRESLYIDYLILESNSNPYLIGMILNDTNNFKLIFHSWGYWVAIPNDVYIFQPIY